MTTDLLSQVIGGERQENHVIVASQNANAQIFIVPWFNANKIGVLEKLILANHHTTNDTIVKLFDEDVTSAGVSGTNKPTARGTPAAPIHPWIPIPAGQFVSLGYDNCANLRLQGGLACQVTEQPVHIYAQVIVY